MTESCRWCDCGIESVAEWTFEGGLKYFLVGAVGNRTRYPSGMYVRT